MSDFKVKDKLRFSSLVKRGKDSECWKWEGENFFSIGKNSYNPESVAWAMFYNSDILTDIKKTCNNKNCINPNHYKKGAKDEH